MARRGALLEQAAAVPTSGAPVFAGLAGGMGRLPGLVRDNGGFEVRTDAPRGTLVRARLPVGALR